MKPVAISIGLLVVLPILLVLLFADGKDWGFCCSVWLSGLPLFLPLLEHLRKRQEPEGPSEDD